MILRRRDYKVRGHTLTLLTSFPTFLIEDLVSLFCLSRLLLPKKELSCEDGQCALRYDQS